MSDSVQPDPSKWRQFFAWLTRAPLPIRLLQDELARCYLEIHRLSDLLTQAYERTGLVRTQPEHQPPPLPQPEQRKTMGEMQVEFQQNEADLYRQWQLDEEERRKQIPEKPS